MHSSSDWLPPLEGDVFGTLQLDVAIVCIWLRISGQFAANCHGMENCTSESGLIL